MLCVTYQLSKKEKKPNPKHTTLFSLSLLYLGFISFSVHGGSLRIRRTDSGEGLAAAAPVRVGGGEGAQLEAI